MRRLLLLLLACPLLPAGAEAPLIAIRDPDAKTERRIKALVSNKGIGSSTTKVRRQARGELLDIGPWSVPFLAVPLLKKSRAPRVRQNAAATLTMIRDDLGLPALRAAAGGDPDDWVRITACLALGRFARSQDGALLARVFEDEKNRAARAAALALAKLGDPIAAALLLAGSRELPRDDQLAAATLLAAAVASPQTDCAGHLKHRDDLVRRAALAGLLLRPLQPAAEEQLLALLARAPFEKPAVRALQFLALAKSSSAAARRRLLEGALKERHMDVRTAALTGLAVTLGGDHFKELKRAYRKINSRSDPLNGPLLFALARTNDPDAIEFLLGVARQVGDEKRAIYATGSLIHLMATIEHPRRDAILDELSGLDTDRARGPYLAALRGLAQTLRYAKSLEERAAKARDGFADIGDPDGHHFWDWTPALRHWNAANRLLPRIFGLDAIADRPPVGSRKVAGNEPIKGGSSNEDDDDPQPEAAGGTPEEIDLYGFLGYEPYFVPGDLGGG